jgi:hypothetical protein
VAYREQNGAFESYEEVRALKAFGLPGTVSASVIAGLSGCVALAGERPVVWTTVEALLADPDPPVGSIVVLDDVIMSGSLSTTQSRSMKAFDFAAWGYADWDASAVAAAEKIALIVEAGPEMYRATSTAFEKKSATDTRLNRVRIVGVLETSSGALRVRVRKVAAAGRDTIEVKQRWVTATSVKGLVNLWSKENGVIRQTSGSVVNRIPAAILDVHPAVLWWEQTRGESLSVGAFVECYDCSVSPFTEAGSNRFATIVAAWAAAGSP